MSIFVEGPGPQVFNNYFHPLFKGGFLGCLFFDIIRLLLSAGFIFSRQEVIIHTGGAYCLQLKTSSAQETGQLGEKLGSLLGRGHNLPLRGTGCGQNHFCPGEVGVGYRRWSNQSYLHFDQ